VKGLGTIEKDFFKEEIRHPLQQACSRSMSLLSPQMTLHDGFGHAGFSSRVLCSPRARIINIPSIEGFELLRREAQSHGTGHESWMQGKLAVRC